MRQVVSYHDIASVSPNQRSLNQETKQLDSGKSGELIPANSQQRNKPKKASRDHTRSATTMNHQGRQSQGSVPSSSPKKRKRDGEEWSWRDRELTHEEIWDDSALIAAWDAAMEEYKTFNGDTKAWKEEPIHQSALWYNQPLPRQIAPEGQGEEDYEVHDETIDDDEAENSQPIDFESFVPGHDASLLVNGGSSPPASNQPMPPETSVAGMSRDEAFNRATQAWYWAGYWSAIYHSKSEGKRKDAKNSASKEELQAVSSDDDDEMLPVQREE